MPKAEAFKKVCSRFESMQLASRANPNLKGVYPVIDPKSNLKEPETLAFATSKVEGHLKKIR